MKRKKHILQDYNLTIFGKLDRSQITVGEYIPYKVNKENVENASLPKLQQEDWSMGQIQV